jgi:hypothetical protein
VRASARVIGPSVARWEPEHLAYDDHACPEHGAGRLCLDPGGEEQYMRKTIVSVGLVALALAVTGLAVAKLKSTGVQPATASFATTADNERTSTCLGNGDTYRTTTGRYVGKIDFAAPNDDLDGELQLSVRAVYNATDKIGWVEGSFRTRDEGRRPNGSLRGVLGESGGQLTLSGFANGTINRRFARLLGGVTATLKVNDTGHITAIDGTLGQGAPTFPAVIAGTPCAGGKGNDIPVKLTVKGVLQALTPELITVDPEGSSAQSCAIKEGISPSTAGYAVGQKVEMSCGMVSTTMTLLKLKKK